MTFLSALLAAEPAHATTAAAGAHAATESKPWPIVGPFGVDGPHLLVQLLNFSILAFVLYRFAIKPALGQLEERIRQAEQLQADRASAEIHLAQAHQTAEIRLTSAADEVVKVLAEARLAANQTIEGAKAAAQAAQTEVISKAKDTIEADRAKMLAEVRAEVSRLVVEVSAKVLEQNLDEALRARLNEAATKQLASR